MAAETLPDLIPLDVLLGVPERVGASISPDGRRLAFMAPDEGVLNGWVQTIGEDDARPVTKDRGRGIQGLFWAYDDQHLLYVQDQGGDENWRLYSVDLETDAVSDLTPFDGVQAQVIHRSKDHPDEILIGLNRDNPHLHDPYLLDLRTSELTKATTNPGFVGWVADADLQVRAGVALTPDGGVAIAVREADSQEWKPLVQAGQEDGLTTSPIMVTRDATALLGVSSVGAETARLVRWDMRSGTEEVVFADPSGDVVNALIDTDTSAVQAVAVETDRLHWTPTDPAVKADLERVAAARSGDVVIMAKDRSQQRWIIAHNPSDASPFFSMYDRRTKEIVPLFASQPSLDDYDLAPMEPFSYTARDGLTIHGYLTFPVGVERSALPTVINVHGGPWARDTWGFNPEAQWLANRGYLCVQVNFRGSTGYGKSFIGAGDREWGAAMHNDIIDAVAYVTGKGWADASRIAAYGASYGGYEALVCATSNPETFACAVDVCGLSELVTWFASFPPYWEQLKDVCRKRVGDPDTEADWLRERSPLYKAANVKMPLLIAQGANDPRVPQTHSEEIVAALEKAGIPCEYLLYENEGHGFVHPETRVDFYRHAEAFLAKHIGGRSEL